MFYANDGMVVSSDPAWIQGAFSALVAIFDRVGLRTNVNKTVSMACHPCRAGVGNWTEAGYPVPDDRVPYPSRISRHLDLSKDPYALVRSRKIT